jgi:protein SCO1/2
MDMGAPAAQASMDHAGHGADGQAEAPASEGHAMEAPGMEDHAKDAGHDHAKDAGHDHAKDAGHDHAMDAGQDHTMDAGQDHTMDAEHDHAAMMEEAEKADLPVGIEEHLGARLPDVYFTDSEGNRVTLPELADVPLLLLPIYFRCPDVCNLLQGSVASILPEVKLEPGKELKVVSLSFDPRETPKDAARAKRNYTAIAGDAFPAEYWTFLTGDAASIDATLGALGYTVQKQGGLWAHPVAAVAVAPGGKVVRYLYGTSFLPFDITMAGTEAAQGKTGLSVKRLLSFCYNYDPQGRRYVFDILRVSGFTIAGFVAVFLAWLLFGGKKKRRR